jgi:biopolymer transport protein ExbD
MKFPRNARIFRGSLDMAPFASVFFLLILFIALGSLVYTPGVKVPVRLPYADGLAGIEGPSISVAVDINGQFYFENQRIGETEFSNRLRQVARKSPQPLTLVVQADKQVTYETLVHLKLLADDAGIRDMLLATLPRVSVPVRGLMPGNP